MTRPMRPMRLLAVALLGATTLGCGLGGPDSAVTTTTLAPAPVVYSAIGGRATVEGDPDSLRRVAYPRLLFRDHLPAQTVFTDLARPGATVADARIHQLPTALDLGTTVATVWFDDRDVGGPLTDAEDELARVVGALIDAGAQVAITSGAASDPAWDGAVARVASTTGATLVELGSARGQADIAQRFADALGLS